MLTKKNINDALKTLEAIGLSKVDIDEEAAEILNSATKTVAAILQRRADLDMQGRKNEPLIVLAGEWHTNPAHYMHHLHVLKGLKEQESSTALTFELPHDFLLKAFKQARIPSKKNANIPANATESYQDEARMEFALSGRGKAPFARNIFLNACVQENIPVKFVDAARKTIHSPWTMKTLDPTDSSTKNSMAACMRIKNKALILTTPKGLYVRNHHMVKTTLAFAEKTNPRIILQHCGAMHVLGDNTNTKSYEQSLHNLFTENGASVTGYFLEWEPITCASLLESPSHENNELISIPSLPWKKASYKEPPTHTAFKASAQNSDTKGPLMKGPIHDDDDLLTSHTTESAYVNAILATTGLKQYGLTSADYYKKRRQYKNGINNKFKSWCHNKPLGRSPTA